MAGSGAILALAKEKYVGAVVRQYLIYQDMHKTVKDFDEEVSNGTKLVGNMITSRANTPESNQARVVQFSGCDQFASCVYVVYGGYVYRGNIFVFFLLRFEYCDLHFPRSVYNAYVSFMFGSIMCVY